MGSSAPAGAVRPGEHGYRLAVLLPDLPAGEVEKHVVESRAMGPDGAYRHAGGRHDGPNSGFFIDHEGG